MISLGLSLGLIKKSLALSLGLVRRSLGVSLGLVRRSLGLDESLGLMRIRSFSLGFGISRDLRRLSILSSASMVAFRGETRGVKVERVTGAELEDVADL